MARKRGGSRSRRDANFVSIPFEIGFALATLNDNAVAKATLLNNTEGLRISSIDGSWTLRDLTPGEGPITIGWASNDLTVGEILEAIQAAPVSPSDRIQVERAGRQVRQIGVFPGTLESSSLFDGASRRKRLFWKIYSDNSLALWVLNKSGAQLTTGALLEGVGRIHGHWMSR